MIADTHAHLDSSDFDKDRGDVTRRALKNGVGAIVTAGVDLESSRASIALAESYSWVYAAVGFHPHDAVQYSSGAQEELANLASHSRVVAIGEIGLDFYRNLSPQETQKLAFEAQLDLASSVDLPVIVHCRQAMEDTLAILRTWSTRRARAAGKPAGVMHCFSGDEREGAELLEMGFLLSFAGPITFPRSLRTRQIAAGLPLDRLLVETDCPYLTPSAHHGRRNEPSFVWAVAQALAEAKGITLDEVASVTTGNAMRLFGISLSRNEELGNTYTVPVDTRRST